MLCLVGVGRSMVVVCTQSSSARSLVYCPTVPTPLLSEATMAFVAQLLLFLFALLGNVVLWVGLVNRTHAYGWNRKFVDVLTLGFGGLMLLGIWPITQFAAGDAYPSNWPRLTEAVATACGWGAVGVAAIAVVHAAWRQLHPERRGGFADRRDQPLEIQVATHGELLAPGAPRRLGSLPGNQVVSPRRVELDLLAPYLPVAFDGLKIAHLSDLHMSRRIARSYFDQVVDHVNNWQPDVVAITGDIVEVDECLDWIDTTLSRLTARDARLFVLGNHDTRSNYGETRRRLTTAGFHDAGGQVLEIQLTAGRCVVAGNEAPWFSPVPDVKALATRESAAEEFRLALLHTPDHFRWAWQHGFHVALAGHNHGGQIRFPLLGALLSPSIYGTRYAAGVFRHNGTVMHVSPGTCSYSPMRWLCPPELNLLTLRSVS